MHYKIIERNTKTGEGLVPHDVFAGEDALAAGVDYGKARNIVEAQVQVGDTIEEAYESSGRSVTFTYEVFIADQQCIREWYAKHSQKEGDDK